ncbi:MULTISPECIES: hypothetical protein [Pseudomonas]|jgi:hypothetical protein|uniref:Uncharacterized protein n=2 Tax=Pseudomonas citronellolis TaxID=53408 RepID=A0A127MY42_9PSED|nr:MULTISPECIES: hypothetical protein [Pseudomonas]AMO78254.1 hypothetical protein PcP3B5_48670 [Pseudomonas citronellolis]ANI16932.1 hypothetical protein A9C11_24450 [Pseudomonas citronellolis]KRV72738.1 hypothetical protein AO742_18125 [Pseudomonas citronellolis]KRW74333.1 hypothetical protein AO738_17820 [Pseudomonas citronellolis]WAB92636.1 hypothetical protein OSS47_01235 [Pseudomonas citronellolis]
MSRIDPADEQALKEVLVTWYGPQAQYWNINQAVLELVIEMVREMDNCSAAMDYIPQPINFGNPLSQLAKSQLKRFIARLKDNDRTYLICARHTLLHFKSPLAIAAMGF